MHTSHPQTNPAPSPIAWRWWWMTVAYFALNAFLQWRLSGVAQLDQAEQLLHAQTWEWGYGSQPPLYTWIAKLLFSVTGYELGTLLALKVALLSGFTAVFLLIASELKLNRQQQILSLLGLALLPTFIWYSQHDLTHTVLALFTSAGTVWSFMRIARVRLQTPHTQKPNAYGWYALLGVWIAAGFLSKYNYVVTCLTLLILCSWKLWRNVLVSKGVFLTIIVAALLCMPHALWLLEHTNTALDNVRRHASATPEKDGISNVLHNFIQHIGLNLLAFAAPFILCAWPWQRTAHTHSVWNGFWLRFFIVSLALTLALLITADIHSLRDRWMLPIWFFLPLWFAQYAKQSSKWLWLYRLSSTAMAVFVLCALPIRVWFAPQIHKKPDRIHTPYQAHAQWLAESLQEEGHHLCPTHIRTNSRLLAGNFKPYFECSTITYDTKDTPKPFKGSSMLLVCEGKQCTDTWAATWTHTDDQWSALQWHTHHTHYQSYTQSDNPKHLHHLSWAWLNNESISNNN